MAKFWNCLLGELVGGVELARDNPSALEPVLVEVETPKLMGFDWNDPVTGTFGAPRGAGLEIDAVEPD
jgi:hypothetical protein